MIVPGNVNTPDHVSREFVKRTLLWWHTWEPEQNAVCLFFFLWLLPRQRREEEVSQMRQKISKQTKMREVLQKKLHQLEEQKGEVEVERDMLKVQIPALEKGTPQQI